MRGKFSIRLMLALLSGVMFLPGVSLRGAVAADPVTFTLFDPTGAFEVTQNFAPRLADLNGKTICEITNDSWEASRHFPAIREALMRQLPAAKIIPFNQFPYLNTGTDVAGLEDAMKKAGCQGAIVGNAG